MIGTFIGVTILSGWNPLVAVVAFLGISCIPT